MKEMKRILSLVLCFVMLVGLLPNLAFLAKAEEKTPVDTLVVMSDLHIGTTGTSETAKALLLKAVLKQIKTAVGTVSSVNSAGDMFSSNESVITSDTDKLNGYIREIFPDVPVNYTWTDHDRNASAISKQSSLVVYDNYYVYNLSMGDLCSYDRYGTGFNYTQTDNSGREEAGFTPTVAEAIASFQNAVKDLDKTKPLFIVSHQPLFDNRNDNAWAWDWFTAINEVAAEMDVAFFFGHNHKYDKEEDYYYAKGSYMPVATADKWNWDYDVLEGYLPSMDLTSDNTVKLNFTHICTGYMDPGTYRTMSADAEIIAVDEDCDVAEISTGDETATRMGVALGVAIYEDCIVYTTYDSNGVYTGDYALNESVKRDHVSGGESGEDEPVYCFVDFGDGYYMEATAPGLTEIAATYVYIEYEDLIKETFTDGVAFDVTLTGHNPEDEVAYYFEKDLYIASDNMVLYHVDENNQLTAIPYELVTEENGKVYISFTSKLEGVFMYGQMAVPEGYVLSGLTADYRGAAQYVVGETLDMVNLTVTAVYTKEGAEDYEVDLFPVSETVSDGYTYVMPDMTTAGVKTVTLSYCGLSASFQIEVVGKTLEDEQTDVTVQVAAPGVTGLTVTTDDENETILKAVERLFKSTPKIYDITVEGFTAGSEAIVTLPIPEGVTNPVVYYVSDNGIFATNMKAEKVGNYVTFKTTHFSYYVVGEDVNNPIYQNVVVEGTGDPEVGTTAATSITSGSYYVLRNRTAQKYLSGTADGKRLQFSTANTHYWYITSVNGGYTVQYGSPEGQYLTIGDDSAGLQDDPNTLSVARSGDYWDIASGNYHLNNYFNAGNAASGYTSGANSDNGSCWILYPVDMNTEITYSVSASDVTLNMVEGRNTAELSYKLLSNGADANLSDVTWSFEEVADPNNVISSVENGTVTFSGAGTGKVKISCTWNQDGENVTAYRIVTVTAKVPNNYPEHPDEGAVKVEKTGTGIDFQSSGLAQIEISASGVPMDRGADVIIMLDTSSSMNSNHIGGDSDEPTRLAVLSEALTNLITLFKTSGPNNGPLDIKVAIADFNGFYYSGDNTPYDQGTDDYVGAKSLQGNMGEAASKVYTAFTDLNNPGNHSTQNSSTDILDEYAFVPAANLKDSYSLNYHQGTNYDYAFDAIYQLGTAIKAVNVRNGQEDRPLYVIFMSDGATFQWNYFHSYNSQEQWEEWIAGGWDPEVEAWDSFADIEANAGIPGASQHTYYYNFKDTDEEKYQNEHRMANAIKGDPGKNYEIIRKTRAGLESVCNDTTLVPANEVKMADGDVYGNDMYRVPGLGAKLYVINFDSKNDDQVDQKAIEVSLERLATPDTPEVKYYNRVTTAEGLNDVFKSIGSAIAFAANNARFVDQMGDNYNLQLKTHTYEVVVDNNGTPDDLSDDEKVSKTVAPTIEILEYEIWTRQEHEAGACTEEQIGQHKLGTDGKPIVSKVLEVVRFSDDGIKAYSNQIDKNGNGTFGWTEQTVNGVITYTFDEGDNIIDDDGIICAHYFWYNTNSTTDVKVEGVNIPTGTTGSGLTSGSTDVLPAETFYWNMGQVKTTELAMRYYVYLEDSMEGMKDAGSYPTNNFATLYYDNYLGNPCYKDTVSPVLAWQSATVSYAFYLVDEYGRPVVNQTTGQTGSFANRIAVTNPVIYDQIMLNSGTQLEAVEAASEDVLPKYYTLFDTAAKYDIDVDSNGTGQWIITVGTGLTETTYVTGYNKNDASAYTHATDVDEIGYDYTHTTVWFAVKYQIEAHPDTVVIDYGLPVDISVLVNDMFGDNGKLAAIGAYNETLLNKKGGNEGLATGFGATYTGTYGDATMDADTGKVRYTLHTSNGMQMKTYEQLMYAVNYTGTEYPGYYYDTITVIPATTIYYEDNFLTYESFTWDYNADDWAAVDEDHEKWVWTQAVDEEANPGTTQGEDRPGEYSLTDANNIYGYDGVNLSMSTYSLGSAAKATVDYDNKALAKFTFWGTGFDIISMTDSTTGTILVDVEANNGTTAYNKYLIVDNYYGYTLDDEGNWVVTPNESEHIWQVPVIKVSDLPYGQYTVTISAAYDPGFDHVNPSYDPEVGSYDFYLDAIRIYDPANDGEADSDNVIEDAYKQDHEGWPSYFELRNGLIAANTFGDQEISNAPDRPLVGLVFIDGDDEVGSADIADYISFGPNNEVYLAPGQRVAFLLSDVQFNGASIVDQIHIGIKSADGKAGTYTITNIAKDDSKGIVPGTFYGPRTYNIDTSTDMYYNLTAWKNDIIVISNTGAEGSGIISLTNIKATYTQSPDGAVSVVVPEKNDTDTQNPNDGISTASAGDELAAPSNEVFAYFNSRAAVLTLRALNTPAVQEPEDTEPEVPETEVPETTVPETTVPDSSEPETTVPEATKPAKPDNSQLKAAVEAAKKLKEKDYNKESIKAVKDALKDAEKVLKNKNASQAKIDAALEALNAAVEALEAKPNAEALQKAVDKAKKLKEKDYTKDSFKAVKDALKDAEKVLKDKNASQAKIDTALEALNAAVEALETKPNAEALQKAVDKAKKLKEKDYTKDSFKAVKDALKDAEKVLKDKNASQAKINAALEALNAAVEALEAKPNAEALQKAVEAAKKLKEKDYTKESFKAVKDALKDAEKVLKEKNASQAEIDAALAELKAAAEALETKAPAAKPGKPNPKEVVETIVEGIISLIDAWFGGRN